MCPCEASYPIDLFFWLWLPSCRQHQALLLRSSERTQSSHTFGGTSVPLLGRKHSCSDPGVHGNPQGVANSFLPRALCGNEKDFKKAVPSPRSTRVAWSVIVLEAIHDARDTGS